MPRRNLSSNKQIPASSGSECSTAVVTATTAQGRVTNCLSLSAITKSTNGTLRLQTSGTYAEGPDGASLALCIASDVAGP